MEDNQKQDKTQTITAIVLAAGRGSRMQSEIPKQYLKLGEYPVLYYSLQAFEKHPGIREIILVAAADDLTYVREEFAEKYHFKKIRKIIPGGKERYDSVEAGLNAAETEYVMIHDGARPCIDREILNRCIEDLLQFGANAAAVPVKDTIKMIDTDGFSTSTPDRTTLWQIQTPQCFRRELLKKAYETFHRERKQDKSAKITDDAQLVELYGDGTRVKMTLGSYSNIKVTTPEDLTVALALLEAKTEK